MDNNSGYSSRWIPRGSQAAAQTVKSQLEHGVNHESKETDVRQREYHDNNVALTTTWLGWLFLLSLAFP